MCPFHVPGLLWLLTTLAAFPVWLLLVVGQASRRKAGACGGSRAPSPEKQRTITGRMTGKFCAGGPDRDTKAPQWSGVTSQGETFSQARRPLAKVQLKGLGGWGFQAEGCALGNSQENPASPPPQPPQALLSIYLQRPRVEEPP